MNNKHIAQLFRELANEFDTWPEEAKNTSVFLIDRTKPFDPTFIGKAWTIEEEDKQSLELTNIDVSKIQLTTEFLDGKSYLNGEKKLEWLKKQKLIRLDAKIFQLLWENQNLIPEEWKKDEDGNTRYIYFDGTVLRHPDGSRYVLCLYFRGGEWFWGYGWLGVGWDSQGPSAVLASSSVL